MKIKNVIIPFILMAASAAALAAGGTRGIDNPVLLAVQKTIEFISLTIGLAIVFWALYKVLVLGYDAHQVSHLFLGGILIGGAGVIASLLFL